MKNVPFDEQPFGWICSMLGKGYLQLLNEKLLHLGIDRYYYTLLLIHANNGEINQQQLAELLETEKVSVSRIIDYLSREGFVMKVTRHNDRRKHYLALTAKAVQSIPSIRQAIDETNSEVLSGMGKEHQASLYRMMNVLKENILNNKLIR